MRFLWWTLAREGLRARTFINWKPDKKISPFTPDPIIQPTCPNVDFLFCPHLIHKLQTIPSINMKTLARLPDLWNPTLPFLPQVAAGVTSLPISTFSHRYWHIFSSLSLVFIDIVGLLTTFFRLQGCDFVVWLGWRLVVRFESRRAPNW